MSQTNDNEVIDEFIFDNESLSVMLETPQNDQTGKNSFARMTPVAGTDDCGLIPSPQRINLPDFNAMEVMFDDGYDSDRQLGPFVDPNGATDLEYFEDTIREGTSGPNDEELNDNIQVTTEPDSQQFNIHIPIEQSALQKMTVSKLREELKARNQSVNGTKSVLRERLNDALQRRLPVIMQPITNTNTNLTKQGFAATAYWTELQPDEQTIAEPENPNFLQPRAPTIPAEQAMSVPAPKHNFTLNLNIPKFEGTYVERITTNSLRNGRGTAVSQTIHHPRQKGQVSDRIRKKFRLSASTAPRDFVDIFLPDKSQIYDGKHYFSIEQITKWTNQKAMLAGAGTSSTYPDFKPFTSTEIRQHLGIYILNGIAPSPTVESKFSSQATDPVHGNDMVFRAFDSGATRRHRHFKAFLSIQDPLIKVPPRDQFPNWKVRPLIQWINKIGPEAWDCGEYVSVDEMTMGFQGKHEHKLRITYKQEGDGFQCDALADSGYTYQVYMRNDPPPPKYLKQNLSPLHSRVMFLFDSLKDKYHRVGMDNLYNSASFFKHAYLHPNKILCHGVTRKGGRGLPDCVIQVEQTKLSEQRRVRGTVKAAKLDGDPSFPNLVAVSVYDTKPVHFLTTIAKEIKWIQLQRKVWNNQTNRMEVLKYLRLEHIDMYNNNMGGVDIADQLRGNYRFDHWVRNRKWWWSIFIWGFGQLITNAYVCYCQVCERGGVPEKDRLTHLEFRKCIALDWINKVYTEDKKMPAISGTITVSRKRSHGSSFLSPLTLDFEDSSSSITSSRRRAVKLTDNSLSKGAKLNTLRLNRNFNHLPEDASGERAWCALHRWAGKGKKSSKMLKCRICDVTMCIKCFSIFHTEEDLIGLKTSISSL